MRATILMALAGAAMLAGCGQGGGDGGAGGGGGSAAGANPGAWARDACKTLPVAQAAAVSGVPVTKAELKHPTEANGTTLSVCNYETADGKESFVLQLRANTDDSQTMAGHIAELSAEGGVMGPAEPVTVATGQARYQPKLKQLVYFPDDARVVNVVGPGVNYMGKSDPDPMLKERSLKIALAAAG